MKLKNYILSLLALLTSVNAFAQNYDFVRDGIYYMVTSADSKTVEVVASVNQSYSGDIAIPQAVTYLGLTYTVTRIGDGAFYNCSGLTSITIPNSVISIGDYAFSNCSGLTSITIPNSVTSIGGSAFRECSSLTSITIPEGVTTIGGETFIGCSALTSVTIPKGVTSIEWSAFAGCSSLTSVTIPEGVTSIGNWTFQDCSALTSVTIPSSVTSIGESAFASCYSLTSVTIPDGVTSIGNWAFLNCSALTSVTISSSVTSIGESAFWNCPNLISVTVKNPSPISTINPTFSNREGATLHVPARSLEAYRTTEPWSGFGSIVAIEYKYRYYNLVVTGLQNSEEPSLQFSEFDLLDESLSEMEALDAYAGSDGFNSGESWPKVTDNNVHTKYCGPFGGKAFFLFDAQSEVTPYGYRFYTASDTPLYPGRNPGSWKLYGSNTRLTDSEDAGWVFIDERSNDMTMQATSYVPYDFYIMEVPNQLTLSKQSLTLIPDVEIQLHVSDRLNDIENLTLRWTSSNEAVATVDGHGLVVAKGLGTATITVTAAQDNSLTAACTVTVEAGLPGHRYYQFAIEAISGGDLIQLSEFDLIDKNGDEITPLVTYAYTGNSFNGEEQDKLFDDNMWTKFCGPFTAGTTLYIYIDAGKRVTLSGYRMMTSGDTPDFPERNPVSWSLLGSNTKSEQPDDAVWTLLDHREDDHTLGAEASAPYDFFFTYPSYYAISDKTTSLNIAAQESGSSVIFTHDFTGDWEALYLPFAIDYDAISADFDLAEIDGVVQNDDNNDGVADFTVLSIMGFKGQQTEPNTPYLIRAKNAGKQTLEFDNITVYPTEEATFDCSSFSTRYEFTGSYNTLSASALKNRYTVQDGELVKGASKLAPCRWYMTATSRNGRPLNLPSKIRIMSVEDVITGSPLLTSPKEEEPVYNVSGQRLEKMQRGINIVGGRKGSALRHGLKQVNELTS